MHIFVYYYLSLNFEATAPLQTLETQKFIKINSVNTQPPPKSLYTKNHAQLDSKANQSPQLQKPTYSELLPSYKDTEHVSIASAQNNSNKSLNEISKIVSGAAQLAIQQIDLNLTIPKQLKELYSVADAKIILKRLQKRWKIIAYQGEKFYRALLYELIVKLLLEGDLNALLNSLPYEELEIGIKYSRKYRLDGEESKSFWQQYRNRFTLHVEEIDASIKSEHTFYEPPQDDKPAAVGIDIIGPLIKAKEAIWGEGPEKLSPAMRRLKNSPAY